MKTSNREYIKFSCWTTGVKELSENFTAPKLTMEKILLRHAVYPVLNACGNSYINTYTEEWLKAAKDVGAYYGPTTGYQLDVMSQWSEWLAKNEGLPEILLNTGDTKDDKYN